MTPPRPDRCSDKDIEQMLRRGDKIRTICEILKTHTQRVYAVKEKIERGFMGKLSYCDISRNRLDDRFVMDAY